MNCQIDSKTGLEIQLGKNREFEAVAPSQQPHKQGTIFLDSVYELILNKLRLKITSSLFAAVFPQVNHTTHHLSAAGPDVLDRRAIKEQSRLIAYS